MAIFDFLKPESEKVKDTNNYNKTQIIKQLEAIKNTSRSIEISQLISQVVKQLTGQQQTSSKKVVDIDNRILSKLDSVSKNTAKQNVGGGVSDMIDVLEYVVERDAYCTSQVFETRAERREREKAEKMKNKYATVVEETQDEKRQKQIDELQDQLDALVSKHKQLAEIFVECPSEALKARLASIKLDVGKCQQQIAIISRVKNAEKQVETKDDVSGTVANVGKDTTINKAEMAMKAEEAKQNAAALNELLGAADAYASEVDGALGGLFSSSYGDVTSLDDVTSLGNVTSLDDVTSLGSFGTTAKAAPAQTQFGGFDASKMDTREAGRELDKAIKAMKAGIEKINNEMDDANDEYSDYGRDLARLLTKRRSAAPAEYRMLDHQIDELYSRRQSVSDKMDLLYQQKSQLNDKLSMLEKIKTVNAVNTMNADFNQISGGLFSDYEGMSMYISSCIEGFNTAGADIGIATTVAGSVRPEVGSASASMGRAFDASAINMGDADKYAALEQELGIRSEERRVGKECAP